MRSAIFSFQLTPTKSHQGVQRRPRPGGLLNEYERATDSSASAEVELGECPSARKIPFASGGVKRSPAFLTGDRGRFRRRCAASMKTRRRVLLRKLHLTRSRRLWRELARVITFFDVCSPRNFVALETREFFRKWRARRDSNAGPRL